MISDIFTLASAAYGLSTLSHNTCASEKFIETLYQKPGKRYCNENFSGKKMKNNNVYV